MNPKELMLGNYLQDLTYDVNYQIFKVVEICSDQYFAENEAGQISKNAKPIPLSESWLLKFGFEKASTTECFTIDVNGLILGIDKEGNVDLDYKEVNNLCKLQYIHELQSLYYALTGKEID